MRKFADLRSVARILGVRPLRRVLCAVGRADRLRGPPLADPAEAQRNNHKGDQQGDAGHRRSNLQAHTEMPIGCVADDRRIDRRANQTGTAFP